MFQQRSLSELAAIDVNVYQWPIVQVKYPPKHPGIALETHIDAIDTFVKQVETIYQHASTHQAKVAAVSDITQVGIGGASPKARQHLAEQLGNLDQRFPGILICEAVVADSPLLRGIVTAHYWLRPAAAKRPLKCFDAMDAGNHWAREQLLKAGGKPCSAPTLSTTYVRRR